MNKEHRIFFKKAVSYLLVVVLCINMVFYSMASSGSQIRSNAIATEHGTLEITANSIIIDGHTYSKAQFTQALQQLKKLPEQQNSTQSYMQPRSDMALAFVGMGLLGAFSKITFTLIMSTLVALVLGTTFVLLVDALPGLTRSISIQIKDSSSVYIDGVRVGINWATLAIVEYLSDNHESIEEVTGEEGGGETEEDSGSNNMGDPNKNPDPTIMVGIIAKISDSLKDKVGTCDGFAKALAEKLNQAGTKFEIIRIDSRVGIYSDKYGASIGDKFHYGIRIGNMVYDNLTLKGMKCEEWLADLGADGGFADVTWRIVTEILSH